MDGTSKEMEILQHLDGMENLLARVFRQQEVILYAVNRLLLQFPPAVCRCLPVIMAIEAGV